MCKCFDIVLYNRKTVDTVRRLRHYALTVQIIKYLPLETVANRLLKLSLVTMISYVNLTLDFASVKRIRELYY